MKKVIGIIIAIVGIIIAAFGIEAKQKEAMAISIIGGADGPTSVFLAGKVGAVPIAMTIIVGVVLVLLGVVLFLRKKK